MLSTSKSIREIFLLTALSVLVSGLAQADAA